MIKILFFIFLSISSLSSMSLEKTQKEIIPFIQLNYSDLKAELYYKDGEHLNSLIKQLKIKNKKNFIKYLYKSNFENLDSYKLALLIIKFKK